MTMIEPLDFSYESDGHIYKNAYGIIRPSVTQSLHAQGIFNFDNVPKDVLENARRRGQNTHRWCAEFDNYGFCDESWMAEDEIGYYDGWLKFRREMKPYIVAVETPMLGLIGGIEVGGTPDVVAFFGSSRYIVDRKCCSSKHPGWALQIAMYEMLKTKSPRCGHMGRMSVQLFPSGDYSVSIYQDPRDADAAIAAVVLTEWDGQASNYNADHARDTLNAWKSNHNLRAARRRTMSTVTVIAALLKPVKSDRLAEAGYDAETFTLYVRMHPNKGAKVGKLYAYSNVSEELVDDFEKAESKGKFFNAHIFKNPEYPFTEVLEDAPTAVEDEPVYVMRPIPELAEDEDELKLQALAVVDQVKALAIVTPEEYSLAGNELVRLRAMRQQAQERVDRIRVPAYATYKAALDLQRDVITPYNDAEAFLNRGLASYREREKQERLQKEAEENRRRREEAEAEQKRKQQEAAEADAKIAEAQGRPEEAEQIRQQPLPLTPVRFVPAVLPRAVPKVAGITERAPVWRWRVKPGEEHLVPRSFLMLNEVAINSAVRTQKGLTNIPGIEVWDEEANPAVSPKGAAK